MSHTLLAVCDTAAARRPRPTGSGTGPAPPVRRYPGDRFRTRPRDARGTPAGRLRDSGERPGTYRGPLRTAPPAGRSRRAFHAHAHTLYVPVPPTWCPCL
ncbi:hypothetical protein GCM10010515_30190 [Streptomyces fructofermentans]|uniref:Uncharacterized protein n=1 Tax=Streptomyces fructofermentans TaxID=152141 RepID=A0A918NCM1_9ACTN|nr:hypothetical protein GCM10010515_30190 [Streptomyces fructofermentans]